MENKDELTHMANQTETIRKFVSYLNNPDEQGGFWLPHYPDEWDKNESEFQKYLIRTSLTGVFGGNPDQLLDKIVPNINKHATFDLSEIFGVVREDGRSMEISEATILGMSYTSKEIHLLFNLWYGFNYQPALKGNLPQIDHIFPQSELKKFKVANPETGKMNVMKYHQEERDQIGNLMLLTATENGGGGKTDIVPEVWFEDKSDEYLDLHLIPRDKSLWKMENYEKFVKERNRLIIKKFNYLIYKSQKQAKLQV
jgi:hypothetical protein